MSAPEQTLVEIIRAMQKPLEFAARNNYARLGTVKGLDSLLPSLARRAQKMSGDKGFNAIAERFEDFYSHAPETQRERIASAIYFLNKFNRLEHFSNTAHEVTGYVCDIHKSLQQLARSVADLPGVGPKTAAALKRMNVKTFEDLLYLLPRTYIDRRRVLPIARLEPGTHAVVIGTVHGSPVVKSSGRMRLLEMLISDGSGLIAAKWFKLPQRYASLLKNRYKDGDRILITGQVKLFGSRLEMHHPETEVLDQDGDPGSMLSITPLYPLTDGLAQKTMQRLLQALTKRVPGIVHDYLPCSIRTHYVLAGLQESFTRVHQPGADDDPERLCSGTSRFHRRIVFDEFFMLQALLALKKHGVALEPGTALAINDHDLERLLAGLPFCLTSAQRRCLDEIRADMAAHAPMHRLLQGDVGSGKTVVSLLAACIAIHNGYQAAIMAPTEILAEQHHATIAAVCAEHGPRLCLLTGSQGKTERARRLDDIRSGNAQLVIGTHALIQDDVLFARLGFVVIDEQHKFGVMQRAEIKKKGTCPDILVMSATPIPRTLGLTVYGDLDVSVIDELPPGRTPVTTKLYNESQRREVYTLIRSTVSCDSQVFIVYPLVESSEKIDLLDATRMAAHLQQDIFPELRVALLHGRMSGGEKDCVMREFSAGRTHILVATTVVEVGIDVPNAALMIIEHAERFGLSQLHQLRGRVGRGARSSMCVLLAQFSRSDDARRRLAIMEQTNDGFKIAEEDFAIRGPGEFLGTRQSGLPDFRVAHIGRDIKILQEARTAAFKLVAEDPHLNRPEHEALKKVLAERWKGRLELAGTG